MTTASSTDYLIEYFDGITTMVHTIKEFVY